MKRLLAVLIVGSLFAIGCGSPTSKPKDLMKDGVGKPDPLKQKEKGMTDAGKEKGTTDAGKEKGKTPDKEKGGASLPPPPPPPPPPSTDKEKAKEKKDK